jgi:hypothetical protein
MALARLATTVQEAIAFLVDRGHSGLLRPCSRENHALI